jgi:hypothetical protein
MDQDLLKKLQSNKVVGKFPTALPQNVAATAAIGPLIE